MNSGMSRIYFEDKKVNQHRSVDKRSLLVGVWIVGFENDMTENGVKIEILKEFSGSDTFMNSVYFPPPFDSIVSAGRDCCLQCFNRELVKKDPVCKSLTNYWRVAKFWINPPTMIAATENECIYHISLDGKILAKLDVPSETRMYCICKLKGDKFCAFLGILNQVGIYKCNEDGIFEISKITIHSILSTWLHWVRHSKLFDTCLYVNSDEDFSIKLIDYENSKCLKKINQDIYGDIMAIDCFVKHGTEFIVGGGKIGGIVIFNSLTGNKVSIIEEVDDINSSDNWVFCIYCLSNRYIFVGRAGGFMEIISTESFKRLTKWKKNQVIRRGWVMDYCEVVKNSHDCELVVSGEYGNLSYIRVSGLDLPESDVILKLMREDLLERRSFLLDFEDLYIFNESDRKETFLRIRFSEFNFNVFKFLLEL